jgi:hypothetical protein
MKSGETPDFWIQDAIMGIDGLPGSELHFIFKQLQQGGADRMMSRHFLQI